MMTGGKCAGECEPDCIRFNLCCSSTVRRRLALDDDTSTTPEMPLSITNKQVNGGKDNQVERCPINTKKYYGSGSELLLKGCRHGGRGFLPIFWSNEIVYSMVSQNKDVYNLCT